MNFAEGARRVTTLDPAFLIYVLEGFDDVQRMCSPELHGSSIDMVPCLNPLPTLVLSDRTRIYGTVASSPRAVIDRLLGPSLAVWARYGLILTIPRLLDPHLDVVRAR